MRIFILIFVALFAYVFPVSGQNAEFPNSVHAKLNVFDYGLLFDNEARVGQGFEVAYFRNIAPFLNVGVPIKVGLAKLPLVSENTLTAMADLQVQLGNHSSRAKISPYFMAGGGLSLNKTTVSNQCFCLVEGSHFRISRYAFINLQGEFRKAMTDNRDNFQIGAGYVYLLHQAEMPEELPKAPADMDGDSIPDVIDKCPQIPGPAAALGCPDMDGDGVGDHEDLCPELAGDLAAKGCPDSDKDGVSDNEDKCPEEYGTIAGCPDRDGDGYSDIEDECPDEKGRWNGCPDRDFDGVPDKDDKCPDDPGSTEFDGCPGDMQDKDKDGFADAKDACPDLAGTLNGCPDADGDGIADKDDKCPNSNGPINGCPDRDGDGVADNEDRCPDQKGEFSGCPDSDGDGVPENIDKCPNSAGTMANNGCPEIKKEVRERLTFAMQAVQFETGASVLKPKSYAILDEITGYLRQYPDYYLKIDGHTDNVGNEGNNLRLSTARAKSCYDYFVTRGITPTRLRYRGFGETNPMSENNTAAGREMNRRVEFNFSYE